LHDILTHFLIYLSAAVIAVSLFRFFKIEAILAYLFAGVLIGPQVLGLIEDPQAIFELSELGVVFLLFIIGLELLPSRLWQMRKAVFGLGMSQVLVTGSLFTVLGSSVFGLSWAAAIIAGFGLALSSTAFGVQLLKDHHQLQTLHGQGSFSILLFQDLAVVPLIAIIPFLSATSDVASLNWIDAGRVIGMLALFIVSGLFLIRYAFRYIAETRAQEVFTATALLIVVGSALAMEKIGLSMGMGAFLAGVLLANSEYRHELEANLQPFKGLLLGLFFIAVGMALDLGVVVRQPAAVFGIVAGLMICKALLIFLLSRSFGYPNVSARNMAVTLLQGGEFAFVLFAAAAVAGILDLGLSSILNAAVTISMLLTPLTFALNQRFLRSFPEDSERPADEIVTDGAEVIIAGFGRFGQIVARFLMAEKVPSTILEHSAAQVDVARQFGTKIFYGDASRKDVIEAAGGHDAKIFVLAIDDPEVSIRTAKTVRKYFPQLEIIARVRNRSHAIELFKLGIDNFHRETYLTSLEVAKEVLLDLKRERPYINKRLAKFRKHDELILRQQSTLADDEKKFISFTNQANEELAKILEADADS
jgi:monovalent cation:proton antiporter-2 (CPA2) family protein